MKLVIVVLTLETVSGCEYLATFAPDSPTEFTIRAPVHVAASVRSIIFKSSDESDNCVLLGGPVTFTALGTSAQSPLVRFSYEPNDSATHGAIARFETSAGVAAFKSDGRFSLTARGKEDAWQTPASLQQRHPVSKHSPSGDVLAIVARRPQHYVVEATRGAASLFRATVIPMRGTVFIRDALFGGTPSAYDVRSQHDCGNWNTAVTATRAFAKVEARIPR